MKPLVSVGFCVHNGENMIGNAVKSVIDQDFPRELVQFIFVDDGSQDRTPEIISGYVSQLGSRAKAYKSDWKGLGHARNLVVNNADGDYVLFVDADQILTPKYMKAQVGMFEENPEVGITAGIFKTVPGNTILNLEVIPHIVNQKNYQKPRSFIWKTAKLIGTGGTAFRTKALRQVAGFDEKIKGASEDTDLVLRIKKAGWLIKPNSGELYELHGGLSRPKDLWRKYFWYGYGCQRTAQTTGEAFSIPRMTPLAGFFAGTFYSLEAYRFLRQKVVFLLPLHFGWKLTAWTLGFMKGQIQGEK